MHIPHINNALPVVGRAVRATLTVSMVLLALGPLTVPQPPAAPGTSIPPFSSLTRPQALTFESLPDGDAQAAAFRAGDVTFGPQQVDFALPVLPAAGRPAATSGAAPDLTPTFRTVHLQFLNLATPPRIEPQDMLQSRVNDLRGSDPLNWRLALPTYGAIRYRELYPGIDLRYDGQAGHLKGTFVVQPAADPTQIAWRYDNADSVALDTTTGSLMITAGGARLAEQAPVAWQEHDGRRVAVAVSYALSGTGRIGFALPDGYDPSLPLVIDPIFIYQTIYDRVFLEHGVDIAVDRQGNAYALVYAYDQATNNNDFYVAKIAPDGTLLWTTYFHGSGVDVGSGLAVDPQGDVYITGQTGSADFPVLNAMQSQMNGPGDAFIARLAGSDGSLVFSTFFGGSRHEAGRDLLVGYNGDIYLTGESDSTDFPTVDPIQPNLTLTVCFCYDAIVTRLSGDGSTIRFSTYLGGSLMDEGRAIGLDANLNIYFAGDTRSDDFPLQNPLQAVFGGDVYDAFAARIAADGSTLDYSTYLGGEEWDIANRLAVDGAGNAYVTGYTGSIAYPSTAGAFQSQFVGGINACGNPPFEPRRNCYDVFVTKLAPDGSSFAYSTFIGGGRDEEGRGIALDSAGNAYIVGYTFSPDFPLQGSPDPGAIIYVAKLHDGGSALDYVLGIASGSANAGLGIAVGRDRDVYITGAINVPADLYVARIDQGPCPDFVAPPGVGVEDIAAVAGHWGETPADPGWNPAFDLNGDSRIDIWDVMATAGNWGRTCAG